MEYKELRLYRCLRKIENLDSVVSLQGYKRYISRYESHKQFRAYSDNYLLARKLNAP